MHHKTYIWLIAATVLLSASCKDEKTAEPTVDVQAQLDSVGVELDTLANTLSAPWGIATIGENLLITEKSGDLLLWDGASMQTISGVPSFRRIGQGGLLDVCAHSDFATNGKIYLCGSSGSSNTTLSTTLYSAVLSGTTLSSVTELFAADPKTNSGLHFGARIAFDTDGYLYLSLGERFDMQTAQELSNHNGTVIRLNDDGTIPADNPYVNEENAQPEIWTYGHRNVQGMATHPSTGDIWTHEHGPKGGDEVNILKKGANYGWPLASYGIDYDGDIITTDTFVEGTERPIYYWIPSIAPCGMDFYTSDSIPQWKGSLFIGALVQKHLNRLTLDGNTVVKEERLLQGMARFRDVKQGNDGYLYIITESPGMLLRVRPSK